MCRHACMHACMCTSVCLMCMWGRGGGGRRKGSTRYHANIYVAVPGRNQHYSVAYFDRVTAFKVL